MVRSASIFSAMAAASVSVACMGVGPAPVRFAGQTNIVVWDKLRGMEHFVRDARFETNGASLGFIAPTPGRPSIEAVDPAAFDLLLGLGGLSRFGGGSGGGAGGGGGVEIVQTKVVAGYEATVLRASNPDDLIQWLSANGYPMPRYASRWVAPYVRRGWYLTAFKVATQAGAGATGPVRMTFKTDVPFNPYSVPAENQARGGLRLLYVSATEDAGTIGGSRPWIKPKWTVTMKEDTAQKLEDKLKLAAGVLPKKAFVSYYDDPSFGRPGFDDIYFVPTVKPPTKEGKGLLALVGLGVFMFARPARRRVA